MPPSCCGASQHRRASVPCGGVRYRVVSAVALSGVSFSRTRSVGSRVERWLCSGVSPSASSPQPACSDTAWGRLLCGPLRGCGAACLSRYSLLSDYAISIYRLSARVKGSEEFFCGANRNSLWFYCVVPRYVCRAAITTALSVVPSSRARASIAARNARGICTYMGVTGSVLRGGPGRVLCSVIWSPQEQPNIYRYRESIGTSVGAPAPLLQAPLQVCVG
jgi:hypothetical protein